MYPAFQPNAEFAVGLNSDNPFLDSPAAEVATIVEEQPAQPATTGIVVPLGVRHNRHFIEANTKPVDIAHLRADCVVPVFSKDNEVTISHQSFIETVLGAAHRMFPQEVIDAPDIVVSHIIKGRIPEAIHKPVNQLLETDKTIYYERMAFCFEIPTIYEDVAGNRLNLSIGGVRAYNHENLYSKKTVEKFKVFIGFKNLVCCNLCVSTDGFKSELRVMGVQDLFDATLRLFREYDAERHVKLMAAMQERTLTGSLNSSARHGCINTCPQPRNDSFLLWSLRTAISTLWQRHIMLTRTFPEGTIQRLICGGFITSLREPTSRVT